MNAEKFNVSARRDDPLQLNTESKLPPSSKCYQNVSNVYSQYTTIIVAAWDR